VYQLPVVASGDAMELLQVYVDDSLAEDYYTCVWLPAPKTREPLLAVAGKGACIRFIDVIHSESVVRTGAWFLLCALSPAL